MPRNAKPRTSNKTLYLRHVIFTDEYIKGTDRTQAVLFLRSLDEIFDADNEDRVIDLFAESIDLTQLSFHVKSSAEGRSPYHPKDLLKLFV